MGKLLVTGASGNVGGYVSIRHSGRMTRMGTAKTVTGTFKTIMGKAPQTFRDFVRKHRAAWLRP